MRTLLTTTRDRFLLALQYQDYRNLWIATTFSASAAWALIIARGWLAFELTDGSLWVGVVTFAAIGPRVLSTPIAGFLADRFDRQKLLRWIFALNMVLRAFQVQGDGAFVGVIEEEVGAPVGAWLVSDERRPLPGGVSGGRLNLDHIRAVVGQQLAAEHALGTGQIEDAIGRQKNAFGRGLKGHAYPCLGSLNFCRLSGFGDCS